VIENMEIEVVLIGGKSAFLEHPAVLGCRHFLFWKLKARRQNTTSFASYNY
jgi:hypothetical protein